MHRFGAKLARRARVRFAIRGANGRSRGEELNREGRSCPSAHETSRRVICLTYDLRRQENIASLLFVATPSRDTSAIFHLPVAPPSPGHPSRTIKGAPQTLVEYLPLLPFLLDLSPRPLLYRKVASLYLSRRRITDPKIQAVRASVRVSGISFDVTEVSGRSRQERDTRVNWIFSFFVFLFFGCYEKLPIDVKFKVPRGGSREDCVQSPRLIT